MDYNTQPFHSGIAQKLLQSKGVLQEYTAK